MPELPEVEITKRGVKRLFLGETLKKMTVRQPKLRWLVPSQVQNCVGKALNDVERRSKYILLNFEGQYQLIHLGMSGALRMVPPEEPWRKHDHIEWLFESGAMRLHDPRRFGSVGWCLCDDLKAYPRLASLGVEPFSEGFTAKYLYFASRLKRTPVKSFLMAGKVVVGVGNIYASEALFHSGIRPGKAAGRLTKNLTFKLHDAILKVLADAIEQGGSSLRDFHAIEGELGYFQQNCWVYGREGLSCKVCETPIKNKVIAQRASFYCPVCQQ